MLKVYAITLIGVVLAQIAPGPNLLAVANAALKQGLRSALFVSLGIATAIFAWVIVMAFGLAVILALFPPFLTGMKVAGGCYLCFLAFRSLRSGRTQRDASLHARGDGRSPSIAWREGLIVNLSNPKSALMWGAITTFMFGSRLSTAQVLGFAPVGFLSAFAVYGAYAALFSTSTARAVYARFSGSISAIFAVAFGMIGSSLVVSGIRDIVR